MIKKILVTLLSMFFVACSVFGIVCLVFFLIPGSSAQAGLNLPTQIEDSAALTSDESTEDATEEGYDNIYIADVHQSLTLREAPDSDAASVIEDGGGLAPMTHMQVINFVENTNFAYVEVINGNYKGLTGYVNYEYITKLGEPTIRVEYEE